MRKYVLSVFVCIALALTCACNFSVGGEDPEIAKANKLTDESNELQKEGLKLKDEAMTEYSKLLKETPDFEDWVALKEPVKALETKLETSKTKLTDSAKKIDEASRLKVPDFFKEYLAARTELVRKEGEISGLCITAVKLAYDEDVATEEEFVKRNEEIKAQMDKLNKEQEDLQAKIDKISKDHEKDFKKDTAAKS